MSWISSFITFYAEREVEHKWNKSIYFNNNFNNQYSYFCRNCLFRSCWKMYSFFRLNTTNFKKYSCDTMQTHRERKIGCSVREFDEFDCALKNVLLHFETEYPSQNKISRWNVLNEKVNDFWVDILCWAWYWKSKIQIKIVTDQINYYRLFVNV